MVRKWDHLPNVRPLFTSYQSGSNRDLVQARHSSRSKRPDTASGVVFVTLEDETGSVNVVVWRDVADRQRGELLGSRLMAVHGVLERQGEVVHLIANRLADHSALLAPSKPRAGIFTRRVCLRLPIELSI